MCVLTVEVISAKEEVLVPSKNQSENFGKIGHFFDEMEVIEEVYQ